MVKWLTLWQGMEMGTTCSILEASRTSSQTPTKTLPLRTCRVRQGGAVPTAMVEEPDGLVGAVPSQGPDEGNGRQMAVKLKAPWLNSISSSRYEKRPRVLHRCEICEDMRDAGGCTAWPVHHGSSSHTSRARERTLATIETTPLGGGPIPSLEPTQSLSVEVTTAQTFCKATSPMLQYMAPPATPPTTRLDAQKGVTGRDDMPEPSNGKQRSAAIRDLARYPVAHIPRSPIVIHMSGSMRDSAH
jgi:hypothetical protein